MADYFVDCRSLDCRPVTQQRQPPLTQTQVTARERCSIVSGIDEDQSFLRPIALPTAAVLTAAVLTATVLTSVE